MRYLLIIHADEAKNERLPPDEIDRLAASCRTVTDEMKRAGVFVASERLRPSDTATTVRVRDGRILTTDGPFAETKEQLGGFYLIEARDLDEALAWAARVPAATVGSVEVRPIWPLPPVS